jgi:hypothetical protein
VTHEERMVKDDQLREARAVAAEKRRERARHKTARAHDPNSSWLDLF